MRKQRLPAKQPGPPLQLRSEPAVPTKGEQRILDLLWREFRKSDDVARAAARFDADVHAQIVQHRIQEGLAEDDAGAIQRVFDPNDLNRTFGQLLQLRLERRLLHLVGLQDYEADIMRERIQQIFAPHTTKTKPITTGSNQIQIGTPETQQIQDLKRRGRRRK